ncbi:MAG TPA: hypothetical protein VFR02_03245 [bacterium]|nr:hypothetical protein [bacterium]
MRIHRFLLLGTALVGLSAGGAQAQTRSIISNLANPAIGMSALFLAQAAPDLSVPGTTGPAFQEAELSVISTVDPTWTLTGNFTFDAESGLAEEAFATTDSVPNVLLKVGEIRAAFGKHGTLHTHAFPFIQAPIVMANTIGEEGFKDAGIEAAWMTPLPWYCELTLGVYHPTAASADHNLNFNSASLDNLPWLLHLKDLVDLDDDTTLELGGSALSGMGDDGLHHAVYGADLTVRNIPLRQSNQRGWILQGEYLRKVSFADGTYNQGSDGWYASFQYRLAQEWWTGVRAEEAFHVTPDDLTQGITENPLSGHVQRASANVTWQGSEFSALRLEYSLAKSADSQQTDNRVMLQFNYVIGFHPPHAY